VAETVRQPHVLLRPVVYPTPFGPQTTITITAPGFLESARLVIVDASGREVLEHSLGTIGPTGDAQIVWDGRGDDGHPLPSGCYFARVVHSGSGGAAAKAILVR
jgi:flagellar hook assembly protein FlgD